MKQSRRASALEVTLSTLTGYCVAVLTQIIVLPWFGFTPSLGDSAAMAAIFTGVSIMRAYIFRRIFANLTEAS